MTSVSSKQSSGQILRDVIILAVLFALFFCFMIGNRPLSVPDEGRYVEIPREMVVTGDYLTPRLDGVKYFEKPALVYWLEAFSIRLFGLDEFAQRLVPAFFALTGCIAVYLAGRRLFGRRSGILASAVLGTSILYYGLSRAIILDMPVSVLLAAALLSFLTGMHEAPGWRRRLYLWGFYAFAALAVLTKGLIGIVLPGMIIGAWIVILGEWRVLRSMYLASGLAIFLLIAAPWHILVIRVNPEFFHFYFIQEHFLRYLTKMHSRYQPPWFFIPIVLVGLFPWSSFLVQAVKQNLPATWQERHEHRDALFLILWAGLIFLFFSVSDSKLVPYILPVFPPLAMLIGRYLAAAWETREFPGIKAGFGVFVGGSLLLAAVSLAVPLIADTPEVRALAGYRAGFAVTLAAGSLIAWFLLRRSGLRKALYAAAITAALFLVQLNAAAPLADTKSVKTLALTLKPLLRPGDEVASYSTYYQDLPVYLERRITVVDWLGELEFGTTVEDTKAWMMNSDAFWQKWQGPSTIYMITENGTYQALQKDPRLHFFPVAGDRRNIIVCNHEVKR